MYPVIKKIFKLAGADISRTVPAFNNPLAKYNVPKNEYEQVGDAIRFVKLNVTVPANLALPILENYEVALQLMAHNNAQFFVDANQLCLKIDEVNFVINDEEELFIISEVFLEGSYNFLSGTKNSVSVVDIGMNVGVTSLFFASRKEVQNVFSFEPFKPTFEMALKNIAANPGFKQKINPNNFGLAASAGTLKIPYSLKQKGRIGISGLPAKSKVGAEHVKEQEIVLQPAAEELRKIQPLLKDNYVICKVDCEGAEFEIIEDLYKAGLLQMMDFYFIEWHYKDPISIINALSENNFQVIKTTFKSFNTGMIYAFKQ